MPRSRTVLPAERARRVPAPVRRQQILDAAITVFARAGFRDASTAAIAGELRVSEATVFRHFKTKRAMYIAALDRSTAVLMEHWRDIATRIPSPLGALFAIGGWYAVALQEDSRHLRLRFRSCTETHDREVADRVRENFRIVFRFVLRLFEAARRSGEIEADTDVRAHAWLFTAVGTLLDVTQIIGARRDLPLAALPGIVALTAPRLGPGVPRRRPTTRRGR
jgi:TetR/AcrR family transcriptional regulator